MINLEEEKLKSFLISKIKKIGNCWIWQNGALNTSKYVQINYKNKRTLVHRISYKLFKGELTEGLVIDHLCRNKLCINPDHLELVTPTVINKRKTHCKRGHSLTGYNLIIREKKRRACRECKNQWSCDSRKRGGT